MSSSSLNRWSVYIKERFPLPTYFLLVGGLSASGWVVSRAPWDWSYFSISFGALLTFFMQLRLMDEYKDLEKDRVANPTRPLPRGVLSVGEVRIAINVLEQLMCLLAVLMGYAISPFCGTVYGIITLYLWLMYREFYFPKLSQFPLIYAVSHQIILLPIGLFVVLASAPRPILNSQTWFLGISVLGAFFAYEICRKLKPDAHPILKTYIQVYGPVRSALLVVCALAVAGYGAQGLMLQKLLGPVQLLVLATLGMTILKPRSYKLAEGAATLLLVLHLWGLTLKYWTGWPT